MHGWRRAQRDGARDKGLGRASLIGASRSRHTAALVTVEPPILSHLSLPVPIKLQVTRTRGRCGGATISEESPFDTIVEQRYVPYATWALHGWGVERNVEHRTALASPAGAARVSSWPGKGGKLG
jgi:hypothetical protein